MRCDQFTTCFQKIFNKKIFAVFKESIPENNQLYQHFFTVLIKEVYVRFLQKRDADGFFSAETIHENSITDMFWV